ncbi:MAG: DUF4845 domain-containing protein [Acidiferrobacterales bacterium]
MRTKDTQKGITMWGIMIIILIGVFFLFLFFKLFPAYMEDFEISSQLESVSHEPNARNLSPDEIMTMIEKRFEIEDIDNVKPRRDVKIVPQGNGVAIDLNYSVEIEMIGNANVILYFNHHVPVG